MMRIRKAEERGHADLGWLKTHHTFSFATYQDPKHVHFRALRVMNEDFVAPGMGFGTHPHDNMEIVTYVLQGALEHKDSMGNGEVLRPGEFQRMSAGSGITHSEFNPSATEPVHLYQIWLFPDTRDVEPSYEQKRFPEEGRRNAFQLVASPQGKDDSLRIQQDAAIYLATLEPGANLQRHFAQDRYGWVQVLRGAVEVNGASLRAVDGAALSAEPELTLRAHESAEVMVFDLA